MLLQQQMVMVVALQLLGHTFLHMGVVEEELCLMQVAEEEVVVAEQL